MKFFKFSQNRIETVQNIIFEVLKQAYGMNPSEYRLLIFRYLFLLGCGCYTYLHPSLESPLQKILLPCSFLLGAFFIVLFEYTPYGEHAKIFTQWQTTSVLTSLFVIAPLGLLVTKAKLSFLPLEKLGQASFHVFLVQMLYYHYWHSTFKFHFAPLAGYFVTLFTCLLLGLLFWGMERILKLDKKILALLKI